MAAWIRAHGYHVGVASLRREHPERLTLEAWLRRRRSAAELPQVAA